MANFQVFTRRMVPLVKQPAVTIQKRGNMSVNRAAFVALGEPQAVELLYDPAENIVGFRAVPTDTEHAYPMRPQGQKEDGPYIVAGMAFTKYYGIDTTISRRWPATMQDDVLCIDLKQEGTVVTSNRGRSTDVEEVEAQGKLI
ncbi:hypothetical protein F4558_005470 [Micromonospora profundi]|uniref:hypothetical protein n=1 Tax=Micromonospora profundi TaxID=1420889 RepID=UPI00143C4939|nr:hypothetical protein [Micromonospora profundi]NJC15644.1 hypothetical protein [Micromonospora profundi]